MVDHYRDDILLNITRQSLNTVHDRNADINHARHSEYTPLPPSHYLIVEACGSP